MGNEKYDDMQLDIEKQIIELKNDLEDHSNFLTNETHKNMNHVFRLESEDDGNSSIK